MKKKCFICISDTFYVISSQVKFGIYIYIYTIFSFHNLLKLLRNMMRYIKSISLFVRTTKLRFSHIFLHFFFRCFLQCDKWSSKVCLSLYGCLSIMKFHIKNLLYTASKFFPSSHQYSLKLLTNNLTLLHILPRPVRFNTNVRLTHFDI